MCVYTVCDTATPNTHLSESLIHIHMYKYCTKRAEAVEVTFLYGMKIGHWKLFRKVNGLNALTESRYGDKPLWCTRGGGVNQ